MKDLLITEDLSEKKKGFFTHPTIVNRINSNWKQYLESKGDSFAEIKKKAHSLNSIINFFGNNLEYKQIASTAILQKDHACLAKFSSIFNVLNKAYDDTIEEIERYDRTLAEEQQEEKEAVEIRQNALNAAQNVLKSAASNLEKHVTEQIYAEMEKNKTFKNAMLAVLNECFKKPIITGSTLAIIGFIIGAVVTIATGGAALPVILTGFAVAGLCYSAGYFGHTLCLAVSEKGRKKLLQNFKEDTLKEVIGLIAAILPLVSIGVNGLATIGGASNLLGAADELVGALTSAQRAQTILRNSNIVVGALASLYGGYNGGKAAFNRRILEEKLLSNKFVLFKAAIANLPKEEQLPEEKETKNNSHVLSLCPKFAYRGAK